MFKLKVNRGKIIMNEEEKKEFNEANKIVHKVEDQWHYETLTKFDYVPLDKTGVGFVRSYRYEHPETKHQMRLTTGSHADYWVDEETKDQGYHASLESHLQKLADERKHVSRQEWDISTEGLHRIERSQRGII